MIQIAFVALGLMPALAAQEEPKAKEPTGHQRMLALLEKVRLESEQSNTYLGTKILDELRAQLAALPADPSDGKRWQMNMSLGWELLRAGETEEAIEAYSRAVELLAACRQVLKRRDFIETPFQLGIAYMRLGENQNCCLKADKDSCLLPIQGGGVHTDRTGSQNAILWFTRTLEGAQKNSDIYNKARWLLNVAHMTLGTYPDGVAEAYRIDPSVFASDEPFPRFVDIAPDVGLTHVDLAGGALADDFDGDGLIDLLISSSHTAGQLRFYANTGAQGFVERTEQAGVIGLYGGLNMLSGDYDNDGDVDAFVLRGAWWKEQGRHPKSLLQNDGHGVFTDVTFEAGLGASMFPSQTAGFGDYDNDGDLDLYIGNENEPSTRAPCELYRNEGGGKFVEVAAQAGVTNDRYTKAIAWGDFDNDGREDLYVSNMAAHNRLYRNKGDGTFEDVAQKAGVELPLSCFPTWFFDYDNDGALDIFVAGFGSMESPPSLADVAASYLGLPHQADPLRLYKNDGRGHFENVAERAGIKRYTLTMGSNFGDLDNDGFLDMYLGTGFPYYEGLIPNVMYRNKRGQGFADVTTNGGFGELQKGHGTLFADFDNDGDQDVLQRSGGAYAGDGYRCVLFENPGFDAHWIKLRLVGEKSNRFGVGARLRLDIVENGEPRSIHKVVNTGGSFGCNPLRQEIGVGAAQKIAALEIFWPASGTRQVFKDLDVDRAFEIREGATAAIETPLRRFQFDR